MLYFLCVLAYIVHAMYIVFISVEAYIRVLVLPLLLSRTGGWDLVNLLIRSFLNSVLKGTQTWIWKDGKWVVSRNDTRSRRRGIEKRGGEGVHLMFEWQFLGRSYAFRWRNKHQLTVVSGVAFLLSRVHESSIFLKVGTSAHTFALLYPRCIPIFISKRNRREGEGQQYHDT